MDENKEGVEESKEDESNLEDNPENDFEEENEEVEDSKTETPIRKEFIDVLKMFAPGTSIRTAINDLLRAKMGALIVIDNGGLTNII